jgi:hypothetical protein
LSKRIQKFREFYHAVGKFRIFVLVSIALLFVGAAGGFYIALALQKISLETKIDTLLPAAITFAVLGWLGSGADILGLLREMYKEYQEERKIPELKVDDKITIEENIGKDMVEKLMV